MKTLFFGDRMPVAAGRTRVRGANWLIFFCLLMMGGVAHAANCPPVHLTVQSGGGSDAFTDLQNCAIFGLSHDAPLNGHTGPLHGTDNGNNNGTGLLSYHNNGDGATSDNFAVYDGEDNSVIPITVTVIQTNPTVDTTSLPNATIATAYSQTLAASNGTAPYTWSLSGGSLPAGITVSSAGVVSGIPTAGGTFSPIFTVTDSASHTGTGTLSLSVTAPTLAISPATLPNGTAGTAYSQTASASGGTAPYTYIRDPAGGALPTGLTLSSTGVLSGTPTVVGSYTFAIKATDSSTGTGPFNQSTPYTVTITAPTIAVTPATVPNATAGTAYSQALSASGGSPAYTFAVTAGALPQGVTLAGNTIAGTPTVAGTFNFTVTATDSLGFTGSRAYTMNAIAPTVAVAPVTLPAPTVGIAYSQLLSASGGTPAYSFAITSGALPNGLSFSGGTISGTPTAAGTFNITVTATDSLGFTGSRAYSTTVAAPTITLTPTSVPAGVVGQSYSSTLTAGGGTPPYTFSSTGTLPPGVSLSPSTGALSGQPTAAGTYNFTVTVTDQSTGTGAPFTKQVAYTLTVSAPTITIAPTTLAAPAIGAFYTQSVTATGGSGTYAYAVTGGALPAGLTFSAGGTLSGTPTAAGTFSITTTATDAFGSTGSRLYSFTIAAPTIAVSPGTLANAHVGQAFTGSFTASGGTASYTFSETGALPPGLSFASNGTLSGTPTQAGSFPVTVHATDSTTGTGSPFSTTINTTLTVDADPLVLLPASPALTATYGVPSSVAFTSSGGSAPRTLSQTGSLPAGMTFDAASGLLSGTPTVTGSFPFNVSVTDGSAVPVTVNRAYTLTIAAVTVGISPATLPNGIVGTAYSTTLTGTGGVAAYTFVVNAGALPQGLSLSPGGIVAGTPTLHGPVSFTIQATDAHGMTGTQAYTVTIGDAIPVAVADTASTPANQAVSIPVTTNDTGVITSVAVASNPAHGAAVANGLSISYTPVANFFGTDTFTYTATGPGGTSNAATVTVTVQAGAVPVVTNQAVTATAGNPVTVNATTGATGGPFTAVAIVTAPTIGTATVNGTNIVYAAPADASGIQHFTYTVSNAFGASQPGTVTVTLQERPVAPALSATVAAGQNVQVDLTSAARGGPFTDATVVSLSPAQAGHGTIVKTANGYRLDFAAAAAFSGQAQLVYTLANAYATSQPATVTITVTARPDPSKDPEVLGVLGAQVDSTRRMATGQISNFQQRLESLHGAASSRFSNGLSFSSGGGRTPTDTTRPGKGVADAMTDPNGPNFLQPEPKGSPVQEGSSSPDDVAFWTGGAVNFGSTDRGAATNGVDFTTSGVSVGADKRLSNALTLGLGVGYGHDSSDIGKMGSHSSATAYNMALYASLRPSDATYIDTLIGYQWLDFDARRYVTADGGRVTGSRNGKQAFASVAVGYEHDNGSMRLTPYGRLDLARAQLDGYTEHGDSTYALDYRGQNVRTSTGALGLRAEFRLKRDFGMLVPRVRVEYQRDFQGSSDATMSYADLLAGPLYRANVGSTARNHALLGIGAQAQFNSGLTLRVEYQALFDAATHANQSILLGIEKTF